jgi:Dna[CI] antecedent DciA-like protein
MRSRERLAAPEPLDAILLRAGQSRFARVCRPISTKLWHSAVGARIAEHALPLSLDEGTLVLRVPSSVWAHELSLLAEELCTRLRVHGINVRALRFRVGQLLPLERPPERCTVRTVPTDRGIPPEVAPALQGIGDGSLRGAVARAASANLAWSTARAQARIPEKHPTTANVVQRAARAPRCAEEGTSPLDPASPAVHEGAPRTRASD